MKTAARIAAIVLLLGAAVALHMDISRRYRRFEPTTGMLYVTSPALLSRLVLSFDALAADVYWIRAVQHYGATKRREGLSRRYELLYPLLDLTTTLDPRFNIAYRFGAILLSEGYPAGPGRPDQSIALLEKGLRTDPSKWQYMHDIGFVHYWWRQDYAAASDAFLRASRLPNAPQWLVPLAATVAAEGGDRRTARAMWIEIRDNSEQDWMQRAADVSLARLDAEEMIERLDQVIVRYQRDTGRRPDGWHSLMQRGYLRSVPVDPAGVAFVFNPTTGDVSVSQESPLFPLRRRSRPASDH
jgi:tetratricopeptide (TPR) repeat protein